MSISDTRIQSFAKYMDDNKDVVLEIRERVQKMLFKKFMGATNEERAIISDMLDADSQFLKEIDKINAANVELNNN